MHLHCSPPARWGSLDFIRVTSSSFLPSTSPSGLQPRAPDLSGHCRTSTASSASQWALPDLNYESRISVGTAGLQPRAPDPSGHLKRVDTLKRNGIYNLYKDAGYANNQLAMHNVKVIRKTWDRVWYSIFGRAQAGGELLQHFPSTRKERLWSHYGFLLSNMNYFPFATLPVVIILP